MAAASDVRVVLSTAGSDEQADEIAHALVERRLAACVNVVRGVCSVYRWKGEVTREDERLLVIKTTAGRLDELGRTLRDLHSYEVPEILTLAVRDGDPAYLRWLADAVAEP
jgi:periplasmic divalent cation tolerance protein